MELKEGYIEVRSKKHQLNDFQITSNKEVISITKYANATGWLVYYSVPRFSVYLSFVDLSL